MKVLITGGRGMLGQGLARTVPSGVEVVSLGHDEMDVTRPDIVEECLNKVSPKCLIHCAAWTDVDGCEKYPAKAKLVNDNGTYNVAFASAKLKVPVCYISTDFVFDGTKNKPYTEDDCTNPLSQYGATKLKGEEWIKKLLPRYFIVRTSWLFGLSGKSFVTTILRLAKEDIPLKIVNDQRGSPTYTADLAKALWSLVLGRKFGLYHITNSGSCTWHEFAKEILEVAGVQKEVIPITSYELKRPAKRPAFSVLANKRWKCRHFPPLRHYKEALKEYLSLL